MATGNDIFAMTVESGTIARCRGNGHGLAGSVTFLDCATRGARRAGAQGVLAPDVIFVRCVFDIEQHPSFSVHLFVNLVPRAQQRLIPRIALTAE